MNFQARLGRVSQSAVFEEEGYYVWCSSLVKHGDTYYLFYSRWRKEYGFDAWVTRSEIALASSKDLFGKFQFEKVLLSASDADAWDRDCFHNPTVLFWQGKYYLYYMGNYGDGSFWSHRNHQRIGVAVADHPAGEWKRQKTPLVDISEEGFDCLMTSNPSGCALPDGRFAMIYKGVGMENPLPKGGPVVCGMAFADHPAGPFIKTGMPVMQNPDHPWSVEDPFLFCEDGRLYAIVKDFQGYFTGTGSTSLALFEATEDMDFVPCKDPLAMTLRLPTEWGDIPVKKLERPQIYFENGEPSALLLAVMPLEGDHSYAVRIPFLKSKRNQEKL